MLFVYDFSTNYFVGIAFSEEEAKKMSREYAMSEKA